MQGLLKTLLIVPAVLGGGLLGVGAHTVHAAEDPYYTVDPRFKGFPGVGQEKTFSGSYWFNHGGSGLYAGDKNNNFNTVHRGGFWSGHRSYSLTYKWLSMNKLEVLSKGYSYKTLENTANNVGYGYYDMNSIGRAAPGRSWTTYNTLQSEKRTARKYLIRDNKLDHYDYSNSLRKYAADWSKNGISFLDAHFNQSTSFHKNEYYYEFHNGIKSNYIARANNNAKVIYPLNVAVRYFNKGTSYNKGTSTWWNGPADFLSARTDSIKWINNRTTLTNFPSFDKYKDNPNSSTNIAPRGSYNINTRHDSDKKMLSWHTGDKAMVGKYFTSGDKLVFRQMSPIIQAGPNQGLQANDGLNKFVDNQNFIQSTWIPDGIKASPSDARVYAIKTDGSKKDMTDHFRLYWGGRTEHYSYKGAIRTGFQRISARYKNSLYQNKDGEYNNAKTVGYVLMVPAQIQDSTKAGTYPVRGGSEIIQGIWHDTGNDTFKVYHPAKPAKGKTPKMNAIVESNDSKTNFSENRRFYGSSTSSSPYANDRMFRTNENDGYFVWHELLPSPTLPTDVAKNKGYASSLDTWKTTQPMKITIPYAKGSVKPISAGVTYKLNSLSNRMTGMMKVGTNGITGKDNGNSYTITIPASMLVAHRNQHIYWGGVLKYHVSGTFPANGITINSAATITDEISGTIKSNNVRNYLVTPKTKTSMNTSYSGFNSSRNNTVHFLNNQGFSYSLDWSNGYSKTNAAVGVGEPLKTQTTTVHTKGNQLSKNRVVDVIDGGGTDTSKGQKGVVVWSGTMPAGGTGKLIGVAKQPGYTADSFSGTITNGTKLKDDKVITLSTSKKVLDTQSWYSPKSGYNRFRFQMKTDDLNDTEDSSKVSNTVSGYGGGYHHQATVTSTDNLIGDQADFLSQVNSAHQPQIMIAKHGMKPANTTDGLNNYRYEGSSIQARETVDMLVAAYWGNQDMNTEAAWSNMQITAWNNYNSASRDELRYTSAKDVKVWGYTPDGKITDMTKNFNISVTDHNNHVVAHATNAFEKQVTGKAGSNHNMLFILDAPMKNSSDKSKSIKNVVDAHFWQNGQKYRAKQVTEIMPPETAYMYGYQAQTSKGTDLFDPKNPEKKTGKIDMNLGDGTNTTAQISTAPVQWVIREQLGDMAYHAPQKYNYAKFYAEFPNTAINQISKKWHVYNEKGTNVSSSFTGAPMTGQGYKISAKSTFLGNKSSYGHKYYFVLDSTTQNNHKNRGLMADIATTKSHTFDYFRDLLSTNTHWNARVGIGNTVKSIKNQNFDLPHRSQLLKINGVSSQNNETTSQLNDVPFGKTTDTNYKINNVQLARPTSGYTVSGSTGQFSSTAKKYNSYKVSFTQSSNGLTTEEVDTKSIKIVDSVTGKDVTKEYTVNTSNSGVTVDMSAKAQQRLAKYYGSESPTKGTDAANAADMVSFKVNTWGSRSTDTDVTWTTTHRINGYDDSKSQEHVRIPKAHAGKKTVYVSPAGQNKWQTSALKLKNANDPVDVKILVTVPSDLHNANFTDFMVHDMTTELTPLNADWSNTATSVTTAIGDDNGKSNNGKVRYQAKLTALDKDYAKRGLGDSRFTWHYDDNFVKAMNNGGNLNATPAYTFILRNVHFEPTEGLSAKQGTRPLTQYLPFAASNGSIMMPVGGVTSSVNGKSSELDGKYFEGKNGKLVDSTIGNLGTNTDYSVQSNDSKSVVHLGKNAGLVHVILPSSAKQNQGFVSGSQSNTSYTSNEIK